MKDHINWSAWKLAASTVAGMAADKLPPAEVDVDIVSDGPSSHKTTITARRNGANHNQPKNWEGYGTSVQGSVKDAVERFIRDPANGEFSDPRPKG